MEPRAKSSVLLIYTGGTIGMKPDPETGVLAPFDFSTIYDEFPYLGKLDVELEVINLTPIDSSNVTPELWCELARLIRDNYDAYDGFVVLHGTDTMSYSASALSFMLVNLAKPVIFTGSQIPIGVLRTDGRENLITAVEIAAAREGGRAVVPEVCICFQNKLFRANRTTKHSAEQLNAFRSDNYPILAEVGVSIHYNRPFIRRPAPDPGPLRIVTRLDTRIAVVRLFPGMSAETFTAMLGIPGLRGVVLETYGAGNAPTPDMSLPTALEPTSKAASNSSTPMRRLAYVSNFAWPYGCPSSAGRDAMAMPTSPTTLPAESNTEWMPSACMDAEPLIAP